MKKYLLLSLMFSANLYAETITLPNNVKFQNSSRVEATKSFTGRGTEQINSIKEEGKVGGVGYSIYHSDASAAFDAEKNALINRKRNPSSLPQTWSVSCKKDSMNDKKTCSVTNMKANLFILKSKKGIEAVSVLGTEYPGTTPKLRIGNSKAMSADIFTGNKARQIFNSLKPGTQVRTQYYDWPYHASQEGKTTIYGLKEAMLYVDWVLSGSHRSPISTTTNAKPPAASSANRSNNHSHGSRSHSHPLPKAGVKHRHGNGEIGK